MAKMTMGLLTDVARVYSAAALAGRAPKKAVEQAWSIPPRTAGHWVRHARDEGLIIETPVRNRKVVDLALILGLPYENVADAIAAVGGVVRVKPSSNR